LTISSHGEFPVLLEKAIAQAGYTPKILWVDGALDYESEETAKVYHKHNIFKQTTNAHGQHGNGPSEKMVDTLGMSTRTSLIDCNLPSTSNGATQCKTW
jgi:hypothetical protein